MDAEERLRAEFTEAQREVVRDEDVTFYEKQAREHEGPALELACGSGRVYLELLRTGVDADGFDISAASLAVLRETAAEAGLEPTVWQADMTEFAANREYGLAYCPFNTMQFLRTPDEQLSTLNRVYDALAPGGEFIFDVFVPDVEYISETYGTWETNAVEFRGEECEYRSRSTLVDDTRLEFVVEYEALDARGERLFSGQHRLAMYTAPQVELLVRLSPFEDWQATGDFTDEPLSDGHRTQVWRLRKEPSAE